MTKARKKLAEIDARLAEIGAAEVALSRERNAAVQNAEELREAWSEAIGFGALNLDGSVPPGADEAVRDLSATYAAARAKTEDDSFGIRADGLRRRKAKLEAELHAFAQGHFDDLAAEQVEEARALADDVRAWIEGKKAISLAALAQRWQSLAAAWLALERAADLSRNHATRLDIPKFPLDVTGALDVMPIPPSLAQGDPTIMSAA